MSAQFLRFATVGLISNLLLYLAYLLITAMGMGHKTTMTILYAVGVGMTFLLNKNWTFGYVGHVPKAFAAYVLLNLMGYLVNLFALYFFVDVLGFQHELIQLIMVFLIALMAFLLQKYYVFVRQESCMDAETETPDQK